MEQKNIEEIRPIVEMGNHGENVRCFRRMRDIKQYELAEIIGVSPRTMTELENKKVIDEKYLKPLAKALKVTVDDIKYFNCKTSEIKVQYFKDNSYNNEANSNQVTNNYMGVDIDKYDKLVHVLLGKDEELRCQSVKLEIYKNKYGEIE